MSASIELAHCPELSADTLVRVLEDGLGDRYEVYKAGRLSVPDVIVKLSASNGAAVQILQKRLRKRTTLKVYGMAPSVAQRAWTPIGLLRQAQNTKQIVDEVAEVLKNSQSLPPEPNIVA